MTEPRRLDRHHSTLWHSGDGWYVCRDKRDGQLVVYPPHDPRRPFHYEYVYTSDGDLLWYTTVGGGSTPVIPIPPLVLAKLYELMENIPGYQKGGRFQAPSET